jgi:hypothetical protein
MLFLRLLVPPTILPYPHRQLYRLTTLSVTLSMVCLRYDLLRLRTPLLLLHVWRRCVLTIISRPLDSELPLPSTSIADHAANTRFPSAAYRKGTFVAVAQKGSPG